MIDLMKKRFQILNLQKLEILEYFRIYIKNSEEKRCRLSIFLKFSNSYKKI